MSGEGAGVSEARVKPLEWREALISKYTSGSIRDAVEERGIPYQILRQHFSEFADELLVASPANGMTERWGQLHSWVWEQRVALLTVDPDFHAKFDVLKAVQKRMRELSDTAALTATQSAPAPAVAGWRIVPEQPTQEMLDAGYYPAVQRRGAKSVWGEMLAAAPASPAPAPAADAVVERLAKRMAEDAGRSWTGLAPLGQECIPNPERDGIGTQAFWLARARSALSALQPSPSPQEAPDPTPASPGEKDRFAYWRSLPEAEKAKIREGFRNDMFGGADD